MINTMNEKFIKSQVEINAPKGLVWLAWTVSERVSEWFAPESVIEAREGGSYELYFIPGNREEMNTKGCKVTKIDTNNELHFTWKAPDPFKSLMNNENNLTRVQVTFEELINGITKVTVHHIGFGKDDSWKEAFDWHVMAWSEVLNSLKEKIENGEGHLCCQP
ncbi:MULTISPECIES: SRPBCC family protein [Bacillus]|uniref:SRPBCC family protein n=1 Tax=Bacillus TaxID=1386 RepID=UPI0002D7C65F|nr:MULTISPECIES: SRPBCC domain-containing protein [Bacillus]